MRAIEYSKKCRAQDLKITERPVPTVGVHELLIEVHAFGLNYADIMARNGAYPDAPKFPFVPGYEVAGVVAEVGSKVTRFKKGDRVLAMTDFGGYAEYAKAREPGVIGLPQELDFVQGAAIPVNFATAYHSIFHTGTVLTGNRILIHAAAGGVGLCAIQLAKLHDLEIFATAGSDEKLELCKSLGAHHCINYRKTDFTKEVKRITKDQGVDIILDSIGGSYLKKDIQLLRSHGRTIAFGVAALSNRGPFDLLQILPNVVDMVTISAITLLSGSLGVYGVNMKAIGDDQPALLQDCLSQVMELFAQGKLETHVHQTLPWEEIASGQMSLESRQSTGKIVMTIG